MDLIGATLGRYLILNELGRGMAVVYKARDTAMDRVVALKVLLPEQAHDREFAERFYREAQTAASLDHHRIVPVYDVGEQGGIPFFAMRFVDGHSLQSLLIPGQPIDLAWTVAMLAQVAEALDYAHGRQVIHRDVKPGNILLDNSDSAYLTDFGIARAADGSRQTRAGSMVGTAGYASPEQVHGSPVDARSDIYSLGVVAYEMLAGRPPFQGELFAVLHAQAYEAAPPLVSLNPAIPPAVASAIAAAMDKDPARRPASAGEFARRLALAAGGGHRRPTWIIALAAASILIVLAAMVALLPWPALGQPGPSRPTAPPATNPPSAPSARPATPASAASAGPTATVASAGTAAPTRPPATSTPRAASLPTPTPTAESPGAAATPTPEATPPPAPGFQYLAPVTGGPGKPDARQADIFSGDTFTAIEFSWQALPLAPGESYEILLSWTTPAGGRGAEAINAGLIPSWKMQRDRYYDRLVDALCAWSVRVRGADGTAASPASGAHYFIWKRATGDSPYPIGPRPQSTP